MAAHQAPLSLVFSRQNTGVGCHVLLQCMKVKSESEITQSCPTLSDPMDYSLSGSSTHGIFQARVREWVTIAFSNGLLNFLYLHDSVLEGYTFLRICPFLPSCPFYWHVVADSSLLWSFVFLCYLSWFLIFLILPIWFFSLIFFMSLANSLSILFIFSKNQLLALLIFAMVTFVSFHLFLL